MQSSENIENTESVDHVSKIREIIFGNQMRDYENRFEELSSRLIVETEYLKSDIELRLDSLESLLRNEVADALEKIQQEKQERNEIIYNLTKLVQEAKKDLNESINGLDDKVNKNVTTLRNELHQQNNEITQRIDQEVAELSGNLKKGLDKLGSDKVARHDLSEILGEVALRLKNQSDLPTS